MRELTGKTAVITGAASGIGLALARRFGAAGMNLVLGDIEQGPLEVAETSLRHAGYPTAAYELDVRSHEQVQAFEAFARERFDRVHLLCNNAGVGGGGPVSDPDDLDLWRWTIDVNLWGVIHGCKAFLPAMLGHGEPAHVVNTASMAGLTAPPLMGPYTISKYGVVALSETLSKEMRLSGSAIGVSVLCPAFVRTAIADSQRNLPAELRRDDESADAENQLRESIGALIATGLAPETVADEVHDAVVADRFWILTHDDTKASIVERAEQIVQGIHPPLGGFAETPPGP